MEIIKIAARPRAGRGKSYARKARVTGWIPAVCYGHKQETNALEINGHEFGRVVRNKLTTHLFEMAIEGGGTFNAVIKEIQRDVLKKDVFLHVDFQHVAMSEKITVQVPVKIVGIPQGVKVDGGVLEHPVRELNIECLPNELIEVVVVDVSDLKIGQSIHIRDIAIEKGEIKDSPDEVVAVVSLPAKEAVVATEGVEDAAADATEATVTAAVPAAEKK